MANKIQKYICFLFIAFFVPVLFCCLSPEPDAGKTPFVAGQGTVRLVISDSRNAVSSRTLLPLEPEFSAYRLSFIPLNEQQSMADVKIPSESGTTIKNFNVEVGEWEIVVYGIIFFDGKDREAAKGSSIVTVAANENIEAVVTLYSMPPGEGNGIFAWSLTVPAGVEADTYSINLSPYGNEPDPGVNINGTINPGTGVNGQKSLASGYYLLKASVGTERQRVFYTDIVHILSYRETAFTRRVDPAEFVPVVILSGSVKVALLHNGPVPPSLFDIKEIWAYSSSGEKIAYTQVTGTQVIGAQVTAAWNMPIAMTNQERNVYFSVALSYQLNNNQFQFELISNETTRQIYQDDISAIDIDINQSLIVLDGNLTVKTTGNIPNDDWEITVYTAHEYENILFPTHMSIKTSLNGYWKIIIGAFDSPTEVYFSAAKTHEGKRYKRVDMNKISLLDSNETINLTADFTPPKHVWIKGNIPATEGGNSPMRPFNSKDNSRFFFTKTNLALNWFSYNFTLLADFTEGALVPDWNSTDEKLLKYNYSNVIKTSAGIDFNYNPDDGGIFWVNENNIASIILDFTNDEYLETGKPILKIEKYGAIYIEGGTFTMGSPGNSSDNKGVNGAPGEKGRYGTDGLNGYSSEIQHSVQLSPFYMMPTTVTQQMYERLMPAPAYKNTGGYNFKNAGYPVVNVSWFDAIEYANKLSVEDGLSPVYTITGTGSARTVTTDWTRSGWRLPTEAEWEYAARAGSVTPFAPIDGRDGKTLHTDMANYNGSVVDTNFGYNPEMGQYRGLIVASDSFKANAWGLYNMHGNVWEFCWDWFGSYPSVTQKDPRGPTTGTSNITTASGPNGVNYDQAREDSKNKRVIRGGSYYCTARYLRSAHRGIINPADNTYNDIGFRLVRNF